MLVLPHQGTESLALLRVSLLPSKASALGGCYTSLCASSRTRIKTYRAFTLLLLNLWPLDWREPWSLADHCIHISQPDTTPGSFHQLSLTPCFTLIFALVSWIKWSDQKRLVTLPCFIHQPCSLGNLAYSLLFPIILSTILAGKSLALVFLPTSPSWLVSYLPLGHCHQEENMLWFVTFKIW